MTTFVQIPLVKHYTNLLACQILDVMQVCPSWCDNHRECWTEIVRMWRTDEAYARRADRQGRRAQMRGVSHHQGNQPLPQFATRWVCVRSCLNPCAQLSILVIMFVFSMQMQTHGGQEINEYTAYLLSHKGKATDPNNVYNPEDGPDAYTNPTAYEKATEYTVAARQRYGETFDPTAEPLDTDLLQRLGPGKQHGHYYMAHSALDPSQVPTLTQVRSTPTSSSDIPVAPRRQSASQVSAVSFVVHSFRTCTYNQHCGCNIAGPDGGQDGGEDRHVARADDGATDGLPAKPAAALQHSDAEHGQLLPVHADARGVYTASSSNVRSTASSSRVFSCACSCRSWRDPGEYIDSCFNLCVHAADTNDITWRLTCAGTVGGFEPVSWRSRPSDDVVSTTCTLSTVSTSAWPSSDVLVAAGARRVAVRAGASVWSKGVSVGKPWGLWGRSGRRDRGRRDELGTCRFCYHVSTVSSKLLSCISFLRYGPRLVMLNFV